MYVCVCAGVSVRVCVYKYVSVCEFWAEESSYG